MYTTKPLSLYKDSPEAISLPPEGPNSAYLVVEDAKSTPTTCDMCLCTPSIKEMPFPQNKLLQLAIYHDTGDLPYYSYYTVYLIPVINQPLSSNRYYAIKTDGRHKGYVNANINLSLCKQKHIVGDNVNMCVSVLIICSFCFR